MAYRITKVGGHFRLVTGQGESVDEANRFLRAIETRGLSERTVRAYGFDLQLLYRWLSHRKWKLKSLNQTRLFEFIAWDRDRKAHPRSINRRLSVYQQFYCFCFGKPLSLGARVSSPSPY